MTDETTYTKPKRKKTHYVDNKKLYTVLLQYKNDRVNAEKNNLPKPAIPNYAGECIMHIANRLATKSNFANYPFREDMIGDGIENCITYFDNFDPERYANPFAYFTQIIYYAFIRKIQKEKRHLYVKQKTLLNSALFGMLEQSDAGDGEIHQIIDLDNEYMMNLVNDFEAKLAEKKKKKKSAEGVEKFME